MPTRAYAAFLRGVMPTNAKMSELKAAFEAAGFTDVKTVLGSGNVVFSAGAAAESTIERKAEAAMDKRLGRSFMTIVRPLDALRKLLDDDPFTALRAPAGAKRVVTFLRDAPTAKLSLPIELDGARILAMKDRAVFTAYLPSSRGGPVFMTLIQKTLGEALTTRTWDTVKKVVAAHPSSSSSSPGAAAPRATRRRKRR
jgi:uncharacterized protein (DUF1697 family)